MPLRPTDFTLSTTQLAAAQSVLAAWDARDPWVADAALEQRLEGTLAVAVAPHIVHTLSPVHAARFLRDIVEHTRDHPPPARGRIR